ncbi:DUF302 domain-containing protein [Shimia sp.]|uniref:DUF302 domain-containing protein n=1 Tax=Shimia sp. TaxID=1954381 RepID=UPI003298D2BC
MAFALTVTSVNADPKKRQGWEVHPTSLSYTDLIDRVKSAAKMNKMGVVTQAGPTGAAKSRGVTIPGNRVIGIFNNVFAVELLSASESAMIEAPVRFYITEQQDGTATLSYKTPTLVFLPYADDSPEVMKIAARLDEVFAKIAEQAIR